MEEPQKTAKSSNKKKYLIIGISVFLFLVLVGSIIDSTYPESLSNKVWEWDANASYDYRLITKGNNFTITKYDKVHNVSANYYHAKGTFSYDPETGTIKFYDDFSNLDMTAELKGSDLVIGGKLYDYKGEL